MSSGIWVKNWVLIAFYLATVRMRDIITVMKLGAKLVIVVKIHHSTGNFNNSWWCVLSGGGAQSIRIQDAQHDKFYAAAC